MRRKGKRRRPVAEELESRRCLAASVGWDGPGQGAAELFYHVGDSVAGLSQEAFETAIETALDVWADVIDVTFTKTDRAGLNDSIDFSFRAIDGQGNTLARAYLPDDVNPARIAGDIEFDRSEPWEIGNARGGSAFDLVYVAVHEIGHALGLDHTHESGSVLAPFVSSNQFFTSLSAADVDAALGLYAAAPAAVTPAEPVPDTSPDPPVAGSPRLEPKVATPGHSDGVNDDGGSRPDDHSDHGGSHSDADDLETGQRRWWLWRRFWRGYAARFAAGQGMERGGGEEGADNALRGHRFEGFSIHGNSTLLIYQQGISGRYGSIIFTIDFQ